MAMIGAQGSGVSLLASQIVTRESKSIQILYYTRRWLHAQNVPAGSAKPLFGNLPARIDGVTVAAITCW